MFMQILMLVLYMPVLVIIYFVMRNETKAKKNLILGVTLPREARSDPAVTAVVRRFLRAQNLLIAVLVLLSLPTFFIRYDSVVFTWFMLWLIAAIALPWLPYRRCNRELRALKSQNGWFSESTGVTLVDTRLAVAPKKMLSALAFVPAFVLSLIPVVLTAVTLPGAAPRGVTPPGATPPGDEYWPMLIAYLTLAAAVAAFYFLYRIIYRQRAEVVDDNTALSAALTQVRRYNWAKGWLWTAYLTGLFAVGLWLLDYNELLIIALAVVYTALLLAVLLRAEFRTRKVQQRLTEESGRAVYTDDDTHWLSGILYSNPNDSHLFVNRRTGMGTTINLARTPGKVIIAVTLLLILCLPFTGIWMMREEFTPVRLELTGTSIIASHMGPVYTLDLDSITSAERLYGLPDGVRTNGTAMKTVLKGNFRYDGLGNCRLCLDPGVRPYLVLGAGGMTYILGSSDVDETLAVDGALKARGVPEPD